ncbi:MAG: LpqN/LpqT family lipoprotein [Propionibacteriaceae bacterium]|jgi:hypothetical protein|nr:LpqN/LpqT family lipoprotein [Propionibacteriaceae bacterium]
MTNVAYPSVEFPALVGVSIEAPEGWVPLPDVAQFVAISKLVPEGDFRPNVIVTVRRMRLGSAFELAKQELHQRAATLTDYKPIGEEDRVIAGYPGCRIEGSFIHPEAGTLVQAIRFAVVDRGPVEDLVQITASLTAAQVPDTLEVIRAIQDSLIIQA